MVWYDTNGERMDTTSWTVVGQQRVQWVRTSELETWLLQPKPEHLKSKSESRVKSQVTSSESQSSSTTAAARLPGVPVLELQAPQTLGLPSICRNSFGCRKGKKE